MICPCCLSTEIQLNPLGINGQAKCRECGLLFSNHSVNGKFPEILIHHYQHLDPHENVSHSKSEFYKYVLNYLNLHIKTQKRNILDIGCGFGYFLNLASKAGWEPFGIEIVKDAVDHCRTKLKFQNIFQKQLKKINFDENIFDAITLWDVLAIVDDPCEEIQEYYRLLKSGGLICIRTRNVSFQTMAFRIFRQIKKISSELKLQEPYVFNKYGYSRKSLYAILKRFGFINIKIINSPLTSGDPYNHLPLYFPVWLAKKGIGFGSQFVSLITGGRCLFAPSILIWAEKP